MENNYPDQQNEGGYRPYSGYTPYRYPAAGIDIFAVSPEERAGIKKTYFGTFSAALIHGIGSFILAQVIFIAMMIMGYTFRYTDDGTAIIDWQYDMAASIPSIVFCIGIFIYAAVSSKTKISSFFSAERITGKFIVGFFGVLIFAYSTAMLTENMVLLGMFEIGISPISEEYLTESDLTPMFLITEVIFTIILAPIAEELMFRGVILRKLSTVSQRFAIFASALIFGLMHGNFLQTILGFCVGIVLGYAAVKTGSLILPIAGHMFVNAFASSSNFVEYFLGEDISGSYFTAAILLFLGIGLICLIIAAVSGGIKFPEYNEYHRKRTFPIMLTCVSFWIMAVYYIVDVLTKFGPATEKLIGE